jgi:hypothetical protein
MFERDYVMRAVKQVAEALARVLGLRQLGKQEEADRELDELYRGLVPFDRELLQLLDPQTLVGMIRDPERVHGICRLLAFEADEAEKRSELERAQRGRRRALALLVAGVPELDGDAEELAAALRERV